MISWESHLKHCHQTQVLIIYYIILEGLRSTLKINKNAIMTQIHPTQYIYIYIYIFIFIFFIFLFLFFYESLIGFDVGAIKYMSLTYMITPFINSYYILKYISLLLVKNDVLFINTFNRLFIARTSNDIIFKRKDCTNKNFNYSKI